MQPSAIDNLIKQFAKLPTIGSRSARRVVLQMIRKPELLIDPLIYAMENVRNSIVECNICGNLDSINPCNICADNSRDETIICVVEDLADLWAFERSSMYRGKYHIMGGVLSAIDGITPDKLNINSLIKRAANEKIEEIILATNATIDGQTTAHYITDILVDINVKITRLAQGIPMGGELDYLDDGTLSTAFRKRSIF